MRKFGSDRWMWISVLAIAAVFTVGSLGFTSMTRGRAATVDDLSIVDVYQEASRARIDSYFSLLSPARFDYTMEFSASEAMFVNRILSQERKDSKNGDCRLVQKDIFRLEISRVKTLSPLLFYGESYVNLDGSVSVNMNSAES